MFEFLKRLFGTAQTRKVRSFRRLVTQINSEEEKLKELSDEQLRAKTEEFKKRYKEGQSLDELLPEAYAVVKNVCRRLVGTPVHVSGYDQQWDMVPFDVQLIGAIALHQGCIAEMQTGEGKTLTEIMPLYLNALTGKPVHLVTVNDYLAKRDCEWVGSILRWLGLTTGSLTNETPLQKRKELYQSDILYGTAAEFGFDYLRDNSMVFSKEEQVQRGFFYAIIDEVDSILIDEARTPLIISGPVNESRQMYDQLRYRVAELVKRQRDHCAKLATEAKRVLETGGLFADEERDDSAVSKEQLAAEQEALRKLWLVGKGTPRNKVLKRVQENPNLRAALDEWDLYYYGDHNKQERADFLGTLLITVDEKSSDFELTDRGIAVWSELSDGEGANDFIMLDLAEEFLLIDQHEELTAEEKEKRKLQIQEEDQLRKERAHNLRQMLRAHLMMEKDVDYIIVEDKIVIIDEHTGRPQPGRRFSDGLHQAIEAKEGVSIQDETQTYATITLQNFFRMYEKLAGMTGTAMTEAGEFSQIYKLEVLEIPTHRSCQRSDANDEIYMTEREKYNAILNEVRQVHEKGRPILIGTESVEASEKLLRIFRHNGLQAAVLNAKYHEQEAEVVALAGKRGAITISTNMAGRGTDIKLEEGIAELGGLYVISTTRHQSRRIDRQLRGRCGRQGDPGSSKFFISFEDSLLRLFASPRLNKILQRFRPPEGEAISASVLNKSIETAQKRVEQRNYTIRKHTLEYDDVMNKQRQVIYALRNEVLQIDDILSLAKEIIHSVCRHGAEEYLQKRGEEGMWRTEEYKQFLLHHFPITFPQELFEDDILEAEEMAEQAAAIAFDGFEKKLAREELKLPAEDRTKERSPISRAIRNLMIRHIDKLWQEQLLAIDHLRVEVNLRSVGQRDPLMEFKHEAFLAFEKMHKQIYKEVARSLFGFQIVIQLHPSLEELIHKMQMEKERSLFAELEREQIPSLREQVEGEVRKLEPRHIEAAPARNDVCPCGSGKKYKKCCGKEVLDGSYRE